MRHLYRPWLLVLATLALVAPSGCGFITFARVSVNDHITPEAVAFIIPGQTTFHEIVRTLGVPDEITESELGSVASYHFISETRSILESTLAGP